MLRRELKEVLILLVFSIILYEYLTVSTVLFVAAGTVFVGLKVRLSKLVRNLIALGIFATYWITYGKVIDPEVGLNFLVSIVVLKLLEKDSLRDQYMILFGLILVISAGSLFEKTLPFVIFFILSFFILIQDFYKGLNLSWKIKDIFQIFFWVLPLTLLLFFFAPRILNPIPLQSNQTRPGEIGYTSDVNISQIESLTGNDRPVFQAILSRPVSQERLYWRGNVLAFSDGWNWIKMGEGSGNNKVGVIDVGEQQQEIVEQSIRMFTREDYFFTLDSPLQIRLASTEVNLLDKKSLSQDRWRWIPRYEVLSSLALHFKNDSPSEQAYLRVPLKKEDREWILDTFTGNTLEEVSREVQQYFYSQKFSYSLAPGKVTGFREFMKDKKIGFCSHYASALGLILRVKGIPSRLVSGFMGGTYNSYANFYQISQNDAHVWVEALENNVWRRLDPTGWISPDRVSLGGEAFMQSVTAQGATLAFMRRNFSWVRDFQQWFAQWDFRFYQWLEQMDYYGQEAWLMRLNLKRQWLYYGMMLIIGCFGLVYAWVISRKKDHAKNHPYGYLWESFANGLKRNGLPGELTSLSEIKNNIEGHPEFQLIFEDLIQLSFADNKEVNIKMLKQRLSRL